MKKFFIHILCVVMGVLTLISCKKDDPIPLSAIVDVFVQDSTTDSGTKYGIVIYCTANYEIKSAKVTAPGTEGKGYQLIASTNKRQFVFFPSNADYTDQMPVQGDYTFEIVDVNDNIFTGKDVVSDEKLSKISIKTATIITQELKLTWDEITGADVYLVKLYNDNRSEILFLSELLTQDKTEFTFDESTLGWVNGKSPIINTNYIVELVGVKFENGVTTANQNDNVQFFTRDSKIIKWE